MMTALLSSARVRSVIAGAMTEKDVEGALRAHRIRYGYTTAPGFLCIRVRCHSGAVLIYRTCSRSAPFTVKTAAPVPFRGGYRLEV